MSISATQLSGLADQLQAFVNTNHGFIDEFDPDTLRLLEQYTAPSSSSFLNSQRNSRSNTQLQGSSSPYPIEWADRRIPLCSAIRHFQALVNHQIPTNTTSVSNTTPELHLGRNHQPNSPTISDSVSANVSELHGQAEPESSTMSAPEDPNGNSPPVQGAARLDPEERQELCQQITQAVLVALAQTGLQQSSRQSSVTPRAIGSTTSSTIETTTTSLKPSEIGYFFPNMPLDWGDKDIVEKDGKVYYRTVHFFTNRIRVLA